jgi:hypothetical protein
MDEQPDILSSEPRPGGRRAGGRRAGPGRRASRVVIFLATVVVALLGAGAYLALAVAHRDSTIGQLQTALRQARQTASASSAATVSPALPVDSGSALSTFPDGAGGSFSMVTAAVRPRPGAAALTWLFVYSQHARPGTRFGLLEGTCGGQYVTSADLAEGTADRQGNLTIVAPNLDINSSSADTWVLVYRLQDGVTLGGIQGPLIGSGARAFRSTPPC